MPDTPPGAVPHKADHIGFPAMALLALAIVVAGFWVRYFSVGLIAARLPSPLIHIHAALLTAWIVLQAVQPLLVASRRVGRHRRFGTLGMALAAAVPVAAILTAIGQVRRHAHGVAALAGDFCFSLAAALGFALLAFIGLRRRTRDLAAHKRYMQLATAAMLGPAIGRLPLGATTAGYYAMMALLPALAVAYDLGVLRRVHRATLVGVLTIAVSQGLAEWLSRTEMARQAVLWLQAA